MNIRFGTNEYTLLPGSTVQIINDKLLIQIMANNLDFNNFESILRDNENTKEIILFDTEGPIRTFFGYSQLEEIYKVYDVLYQTEYKDHEISPQSIDAETGEMIPSIIERETIEHRADVFYLTLKKPDITEQVNKNTANIEFIAIMSDIEL